jgi:hypothetical protein
MKTNLVLLIAATAGLAAAPGPAHAVESPRPPSAYCLAFTVTTQGGAKPEVQHLMLMSTERDAAELFVGTNLSLSNGTRSDVGTKLHASFELDGEALVLLADLEMTTVDPPKDNGQVFHRVNLRGRSRLTLGKKATLATVDDGGDGRRSSLEVMASRCEK